MTTYTPPADLRAQGDQSRKQIAGSLPVGGSIDSRVADRGTADRTLTPLNGPDRLSFDDALAMLFEAIGGADLTYSDYAKGALDARNEHGRDAQTAMVETARHVIDELVYERLGDDVLPEPYRARAIAGLRALITSN